MINFSGWLTWRIPRWRPPSFTPVSLSLSLYKIVHLLQTCPPPLIQEAWKEFDEALRDAMSDLVGCPLTDWKATLEGPEGRIAEPRKS